MKLNKYFPFVFIYFFVNSVALPFGLTYTALLAPVFYIWIILTRKKELLLPFLAILCPFVLIHIFSTGVDISSYAISFLNLLLVYVFCQAVYTFLLECRDIEKIFRSLLVINFILCLIAIIFYFTPWWEVFWIQQNYTQGVSEFKRLKLFTYEASYYATLFTPLFLFFLLQYFFRQNKIKSMALLLMLFLPLLLSFSIAVIGSIFISFLFTWLMHFKTLTAKRRILNWIVNSVVVLGIIGVIGILYFRHNPVLIRIANIFAGQDLSAKGRTWDAYLIAERLLQQKGQFFGIGIGQIKIAGGDVIREYYLYPPWHEVSIPNAVAETLAIFGWVGLVLRFGIEIFLFFYTKVWSNYFRLLLFIFIFVFQFAGSFITNVAEYVIWILAFTNVFKQFDVKSYRREFTALSMASS